MNENITWIKDHIEGTGYLILPFSQKHLWFGYYQENPHSLSPDFSFNGQKFDITTDFDLDHPQTDWASLWHISPPAVASLINLSKINLLHLRPEYLTAWENYYVGTFSYHQNFYLICSMNKDSTFGDIISQIDTANFQNLFTWDAPDSHYRLLQTTEHGANNDSDYYLDFSLSPGKYNFSYSYPSNLFIYQFTPIDLNSSTTLFSQFK